MKTLILLVSSLGLVATASGGPAADTDPPPTNAPDLFEWLRPSLDWRTRYEFREVDGNDPSHALTSRARVGLTLGEFSGFSAFGELEATYAIIDDMPASGFLDEQRPHLVSVQQEMGFAVRELAIRAGEILDGG